MSSSKRSAGSDVTTNVSAKRACAKSRWFEARVRHHDGVVDREAIDLLQFFDHHLTEHTLDG